MGLILILCSAGGYFYYRSVQPFPTLRIGYFLGGRTMLPFRALLDGSYEREKLNLIFQTKALYTDTWVDYDKTNADTILKKKYSESGVAFFMINASRSDDRASIIKEEADYNYGVPILLDTSQIVSDAF